MISIYIINTRIKDIILDYILQIYNSILFEKSNSNIKTQINFGSKSNIITSIYTLKLGC